MVAKKHLHNTFYIFFGHNDVLHYSFTFQFIIA